MGKGMEQLGDAPTGSVVGPPGRDEDDDIGEGDLPCHHEEDVLGLGLGSLELVFENAESRFGKLLSQGLQSRDIVFGIAVSLRSILAGIDVVAEEDAHCPGRVYL